MLSFESTEPSLDSEGVLNMFSNF